MGNLVAVVLLMSVVYMAIGMVFTRQLLSLAGASDNILTYAEKYLRIVFASDLHVRAFLLEVPQCHSGLDKLGEDRCVCCRLNAHAVGFEQGDKNGVEDNVEDRAAGDNGHCLFTLVQQTVIYRVASAYGGETSQILLGAALRFWNFSFVPLW